MLTDRSRLAMGLVFLPMAILAQSNEITGNARETAVGRNGKAALHFDLNAAHVSQGGPELQVKLPGGGVALLKLKGFEKRDGRDGLWRGVANNRADSEVLLTLKSGFLAGTVRIGTDLYEIRPVPGGHVIESLNVSSFPACGGAKQLPGTAGDIAGAGISGAGSPPTAADGIVADVMSVFTPQARAAAGGVAQMQAVVQAAVDSANQAFANSGVNGSYRLVYAGEVAHNDAGNLDTDLTWVANDPTVASLRNQYGADMVSLIVENGAGYCGLGYVQRYVGSSFASSAFQVTARGCSVGNLSWAHEHGHNIGMEHDPANGSAPSSASYPWSFGYLVNGVFRTVMSYASACPNGCTRVAYFSNPNVAYLGYPTGVANTQDNARTANLTLPVVAGFRPTAATAPPTAPSGLGAVAAGATQINLAWTDTATTETGFKVERSQDGGATFALVATLGSNVTAYANTGLTASTAYVYRVRAYNGMGDSANSNTASATTGALNPPAAPGPLAAAAVSSSQINLTWADGSTNESGFLIERSTSGGAFVQIASTGANITSFASTGLTGSTAYAYRVRAHNADGYSAYSNVASATTPASPPPAPSGLVGTPNYTGTGRNRTLVSILVSWTDVTGETLYRLEGCKLATKNATSCTYGPISTPAQNSRSYLDSSVATTGKGSYLYRLRAENAAGVSGWVGLSVNAN